MLEKLGRLHMDATPPEERIYLSVSNEVDAPRQCTFNASIAPTSSPNFETQEIPEVLSAWNQWETVLALHPNTMIGTLIKFSFLNPWRSRAQIAQTSSDNLRRSACMN